MSGVRKNSPTMQALEKAVADGDFTAIDLWWEGQKALRSPLCEDDPDDDSRQLVTIAWRGRASHVIVMGPLGNYQDYRQSQMIHIPGTDFHYLTYTLARTTRVRYWLAPDEPLQGLDDDDDKQWDLMYQRACLDPLNPHSVTY